MKKRKKITLAVVAGLLVGLLMIGAVAAQTGGVYSLTWYTVDGGGGTASGGGYVVSGTAGQADAGSLSGGSYALQSGFWGGIGAGGAAGGYKIYLPMVID